MRITEMNPRVQNIKEQSFSEHRNKLLSDAQENTNMWLSETKTTQDLKTKFSREGNTQKKTQAEMKIPHSAFDLQPSSYHFQDPFDGD